MNARTKRNLLLEAAQALICERLIKLGHSPTSDPVWLARLLVARLETAALLAHQSLYSAALQQKKKRLMRSLLAKIALIALTLVAGCASEPARDINDPSNSLIFGYIDMANAPTGISEAWIEQLAPPTKARYWQMAVKDGLFVNSHLPVGSYQLGSLGGSAFLRGEYRYTFGRQGNETQVRITKPGIYFLGSFKFREVKTGMLEQGKFSIERVKQPSEAELLKKLLEKDYLKNSIWGEKIRARLAQLNR